MRLFVLVSCSALVACSDYGMARVGQGTTPEGWTSSEAPEVDVEDTERAATAPDAAAGVDESGPAVEAEQDVEVVDPLDADTDPAEALPEEAAALEDAPAEFPADAPSDATVEVADDTAPADETAIGTSTSTTSDGGTTPPAGTDASLATSTAADTATSTGTSTGTTTGSRTGGSRVPGGVASAGSVGGATATGTATDASIATGTDVAVETTGDSYGVVTDESVGTTTDEGVTTEAIAEDADPAGEAEGGEPAGASTDTASDPVGGPDDTWTAVATDTGADVSEEAPASSTDTAVEDTGEEPAVDADLGTATDTDLDAGTDTDTATDTDTESDTGDAPFVWPDLRDGAAVCALAAEMPEALDHYQVAGDRRVLFCHRAGRGNVFLLETDAHGCDGHARHHDDLFPSTGCDS
ncbi:MAG: hypothetical protein RLZZ299_944 [Pseudomonadota bacterium]